MAERIFCFFLTDKDSSPSSLLAILLKMMTHEVLSQWFIIIQNKY